MLGQQSEATVASEKWKCYLLFDQSCLCLQAGLQEIHQRLKHFILLSGEIKKGFCPGTLFLMGLLVSCSHWRVKGMVATFPNCFYLKCLPKRAGDRRACLSVSHEECQQAGVAGRDAWCGPAGSVSVAGVGCQQPARAADGSHVGGHGICTATAATCCVALLLRHYVEHTMSSPGKCCSLQLILSHSACVLCFRRRAVILEDLTPFLDGDIPSCTHHKVPEAHPSTVLKHCAMNREERSWQSNTTPY